MSLSSMAFTTSAMNCSVCWVGAAVTSLKDLVAHLERALGRPARLRQLPDQAGDVPITYADTRLAERDFGFRARIGIGAGIDKFCAWYVTEKQAGRIP